MWTQFSWIDYKQPSQETLVSEIIEPNTNYASIKKNPLKQYVKRKGMCPRLGNDSLSGARWHNPGAKNVTRFLDATCAVQELAMLWSDISLGSKILFCELVFMYEPGLNEGLTVATVFCE